jgi:glycosyltransferase involved in cell wall biosynthesis
MSYICNSIRHHKNMLKKQKMLVVLLTPSPFALRDIVLLKKHFDVSYVCFRRTSGVLYPLELIKMAGYTLMKYINGYRMYYTVFADTHALFPVVLSKVSSMKTYVCVGGFEVNTLAEINYGARLSFFRRVVVDTVLKNATYVLPKSESLTKKVITIRGKSSGVFTVANGFDAHKFSKGDDSNRKKNSVLSIATISNERTFYLKGIDHLIRFAQEYSELNFTVAGVRVNMRYKFPNLPNLTVIDYVNHEEIESLYRSSEYYLLTSLSEGMPNVLCEAIFSGCVPITSDVGNAPYIVGDEKLVLKDYNFSSFKDCFSYASDLSPDDRLGISTRARELFSLENRENKLLEVIGLNRNEV